MNILHTSIKPSSSAYYSRRGGAIKSVRKVLCMYSYHKR